MKSTPPFGGGGRRVGCFERLDLAFPLTVVSRPALGRRAGCASSGTRQGERTPIQRAQSWRPAMLSRVGRSSVMSQILAGAAAARPAQDDARPSPARVQLGPRRTDSGAKVNVTRCRPAGTATARSP